MVWQSIIAQTSGSPLKLLLFGTGTCAALYFLGTIFSASTVPDKDARQRQKELADLPYDNQRLVRAQQQRLSAMIRDIAEGRDDKHWSAVMQGTLVPHPAPENKTQALDNLRRSAAAAAAAEAQPPARKGWLW